MKLINEYSRIRMWIFFSFIILVADLGIINSDINLQIFFLNDLVEIILMLMVLLIAIATRNRIDRKFVSRKDKAIIAIISADTLNAIITLWIGAPIQHYEWFSSSLLTSVTASLVMCIMMIVVGFV